jgi:DNA replication protein DnaD
MKTKIKKSEKDFDTVKTFRDIKEKLSIEMSNMTFEQIKAYLKSNSLKFQNE